MTDYGRPGDQPIAAGTTGWTTETLKTYTDARFEAMKELMTSLTRESDRRYEQRFEDQQTAISAALAAARTAVDAALASAKDAVSKAEAAAEKRFEGVNEFRATLADQQRDLMPRPEAEQRMKTIEERLTKAEVALIASGSAKTGGKEMYLLLTGGVMFLLGAAATIYGLTK